MFKKIYFEVAVLLSLVVLLGCDIKTTKNVDTSSASANENVIDNMSSGCTTTNVGKIVENSVSWGRATNDWLVELEKNKAAAEYLDSYKGRVALRENIPSEDIYRSIKKHTAEYGIGPEVIVGLTIRESNVSQAPRDSSANCRGMCQISKYVLDDFNTRVIWKKYHDGSKFYTWEDMYDYDKNIEVACWYLRWLWDTFDDVKTVEDVLICYNVGHGNLKKYKSRESYTYHTFIIARAREYLTLVNS